MIFNHLSKCLNLCNLRHNRLRPVELLVFLELIKVFFQTLLRFHKFQVCSIFKVLRCCLSDSLFIIPHWVPFVKNFFEIFLKKFLTSSISWNPDFPHRYAVSGAVSLADSSDIIPWFSAFVNTFFRFFPQIFELIFGILHIGVFSRLKYYLGGSCFWFHYLL